MTSKKTDMQGSNRRSFLMQATGAAGLLAGTGLEGSFQILRAAKTDSAGAVATTAYGKIKGGAQGKPLAFKGIPYGASTEGSRFLPPSKPMAWTGIDAGYSPNDQGHGLAASPVVEILAARGRSTPLAVKAWLDSEFPVEQ